MKFTKKLVTIEAFQMTRERRVDNADWPEWLNEAWNKPHSDPGAVYPKHYPESDGTDNLMIRTLEGSHQVSWDDWIIRGVQGELYPCNPDIFAATYTEAFIHKLEDGSPDQQPGADEELVAYLGMSAELFQTIFNHSNNVKIKVACGNALEMAKRLGEEHRSMYIPYSQMVRNLFKEMGSPEATLMHAGVGVAGEAGELIDAIKKNWVYGKKIDAENLLEEMGDLTFYMQQILNMFGWTWADIRMANRMKLAKRYPDGVYSDQHAQERLDKQGEGNNA